MRERVISFLVVFNEHCTPNIVAILKTRDISKRTLSLIESILMRPAIGIDPSILLIKEDESGVSKNSEFICRSVFVARCSHYEGIMELCQKEVLKYKRASALGIQINPYLHNISNSIGDSESSQMCAQLSVEILDVAQCIKSSVELDRVVPYLVATVLFAKCCPEPFVKSCRRFILSLPDIKEALGGAKQPGDQNMLVVFVSLWLRVLRTVIATCSDAFVEAEMISMRNHLFPNFLKFKSIMGDATSLALYLEDGMQLLFQCVGYFQDDALKEYSNIFEAAHYIELIGTVVSQNMSNISDRYHALISRKTSELRVHSEEFSNKEGSSCYSSRHNSLFGRSVVEDQVFSEPFDDNTLKASYMRETEIKDELSKSANKEICSSVSSSDSFLGCFLPFVVALIEGESVHPVIKAMSIRTLGCYMLCSNDILQEYLPLLRAMILSPSILCNYSEFALGLQALATFLTTFKPGISDPSVLVDAILHLAHGDGANHSARDETALTAFYYHAADVICVLIKEGLVRVEVEFGILLLVMIRRVEKFKDSILQKNGPITHRFVRLCTDNERLLSRLCFFAIKSVGDNCSVKDTFGCSGEVKSRLVQYLSRIGLEGRQGLLETITEIVSLAGSCKLSAQLEASGDKVVTEALSTGDEAYLQFLHIFPLSNKSRNKLRDASMKQNAETDDKPASDIPSDKTRNSHTFILPCHYQDEEEVNSPSVKICDRCKNYESPQRKSTRKRNRAGKLTATSSISKEGTARKYASLSSIPSRPKHLNLSSTSRKRKNVVLTSSDSSGDES